MQAPARFACASDAGRGASPRELPLRVAATDPRLVKLAALSQTLAVSLDILDVFRTLCYKHQDDAVLLFSQQRALTPTLVICLEQCSSAIWGVDVGIEEMRRFVLCLAHLCRDPVFP